MGGAMHPRRLLNAIFLLLHRSLRASLKITQRTSSAIVCKPSLAMTSARCCQKSSLVLGHLNTENNTGSWKCTFWRFWGHHPTFTKKTSNASTSTETGILECTWVAHLTCICILQICDGLFQGTSWRFLCCLRHAVIYEMLRYVLALYVHVSPLFSGRYAYFNLLLHTVDMEVCKLPARCTLEVTTQMPYTFLQGWRLILHLVLSCSQASRSSMKWWSRLSWGL